MNSCFEEEMWSVLIFSASGTNYAFLIHVHSSQLCLSTYSEKSQPNSPDSGADGLLVDVCAN